MRASFDKRVIDGLQNFSRWNDSSPLTNNIEPWFRSKKRTCRAYLPAEYCVRNHIRNYPNCGLPYLAEVVRKLAPDEADILDVDYGPGAHRMAPFTYEEQVNQRKK